MENRKIFSTAQLDCVLGENLCRIKIEKQKSKVKIKQ